jgi:hypothetical protein
MAVPPAGHTTPPAAAEDSTPPAALDVPAAGTAPGPAR